MLLECEPLNVVVVSRNFDSHHVIIPGILQLDDLSLIVSINSSFIPRIYFKGIWSVAGEKNQIQLDFNSQTNKLEASSDFSILFRDLVHTLTQLPVPLPKGFDSIGKKLKLVGTFDNLFNGMLIISAGTDPSKQAYLIVNKEHDSVKYAVVVDIGDITLSSMVKAVFGKDISTIPFIGSLGLPEIAVAVSNGKISSDVLTKTFDGANLLHHYNNTIPSGVSGFIRFDFSDVIFKVTYQNNLLSFNAFVGSLSIGNVLKKIPNFNIPSGITDLLDIKISRFGYDFSTHNIFIKADFDTALSFLDGILPIHNPSILMNIDSSTKNFVADISGQLAIFNIKVPIHVKYLSNLHLFKVVTGFNVPSLSVSSMVRQLGIPQLPLLDKFSAPSLAIKISGNLNGLSNGIVVIEANIDSKNRVFAILKKDNKVLTRALAADIAQVKLSDLVQNLVGQDISSTPFFGSLALPKMGLSISNGSISSDLMQMSFKGTKMLKYFNNQVPKGFEGFLTFGKSDSLFKATKDDKAFTFEVISGALSIGQLLKSIPKFKIPSGITNMLDIRISTFGFNYVTKNVFLKANFNKAFNFLNGVLPVQSPSLILTINTATRSVTGQIDGKLTLSSIKVPIDLKYRSDIHQFKGATEFTLPSLSFGSLAKDLGVPLPNLPTKISISGQPITLNTELNGLSHGIVVIGISIGSHDKIFVVIKKDAKSFAAATLADMRGIKLSDLVKKLMGKDISSIPFLGSLALPEIGLAVSKGNISSHLIGESFHNTSLLRYYDNSIPSGFSGFIKFDFSSTVFKVAYNSKSISFNPRKIDSSFNVKKLLSLIPNFDISKIHLPLGLSNIFDIQIGNFGFDVSDNTIFVEFQLTKTLKYFGGLLQISHPSMRLDVEPKKADVSVRASGKLVLANTNFLVSIARVNRKYYLTASTHSISMSNILSSFSAKVLPSQMQSLVGKLPFLNFGVEDFNMLLPLNTQNSEIFLSGSPSIAGYKLVRMHATITRNQGSGTSLALKLDLSKTNVAETIGKIAPFALPILKKIPLLNQDVGTDIIIAPKGISDLKFSKDDVPIKVNQGITFQANIPFPSGSACNSDAFCKVAKIILPPNIVLHIDTSIVSAADFKLMASISGSLNLPGGLAITRAGMEIRVGEDTSIGIVGQLALKNPKLVFTSRIYASPSGVIMEMIAAGCWNNAFHLGLIDICNIHGSAGVGATIITELSLGGEVHFGVGSCSHGQPLKAKAYVGVNTIEPKNNYFYANFPQGLSIDAFMKALCIDLSFIPKPITSTGLEPGFLASFTASAAGKSIPEINLFIPPGLQVNGTVNILGVKASANISSSPSKGIYASFSLSKLDAGGLLQMTAANDHSRGPYMIADLRPPHVKVEASGIITVLGITAEATLSIGLKGMSVKVKGNILGIVQAEITLTAATGGGSFSSSKFECSGKFSNSFFSTITEGIKKASEGAAKAASSAIDAAQNLVNSRSGDFKKANDKLEDAKRAISKAQGSFNNGGNKVKSLKNKLNHVCPSRHCKSGKS